MDRKPVMHISEVLRIALEESDADRILKERQAILLWEKTVGSHIASLCTRPTVAHGVMQVGIAEASLRHELTMQRSAIIRIINKALRQEILTDIRFRAP